VNPANTLRGLRGGVTALFRAPLFGVLIHILGIVAARWQSNVKLRTGNLQFHNSVHWCYSDAGAVVIEVLC